MTDTSSPTPAGAAVASTEAGDTRISTRAAEHIVAAALAHVPGVITIDSKLGGLGRRGYPRLMVQLDPTTRKAAVDANIAVAWPSPVTQVAQAAKAAVSQALEAHVGYQTTRVNITVGLAEPGARVAAADVAAHRPAAVIAPAYRAASVRQPELVDVPAAAAIRSVPVPPAPQVRSVPAPSPARVTGVERPTASPLSLRPVSAPTPARPRAVRAPEPVALRPVTVPAPAPLRAPEAPGFSVVRVEVPVPKPLRAIEIIPGSARGGVQHD